MMAVPEQQEQNNWHLLHLPAWLLHLLFLSQAAGVPEKFNTSYLLNMSTLARL
jgi:hypothetical protein